MLNHISYLGSRILLALYAIELGARPFTIGILVALYSLMPLMLSVYAGRLSDRLGHRLPMLVGSIVAVFGMVVGYSVEYMGHPSTYLVLAAVTLAFGLTPVFWTNTVFLAVGGYFSRR